MNEEKLFNDLDKRGALKKLTPEFMKFERVGQKIIGRLVGMADVSSSRGDGTYKQYMLETEKGLVKFQTGSATDNEILPLLKPDRVYAFVFKGQEKGKSGYPINRFEVFEVDESIQKSLPLQNDSD